MTSRTLVGSNDTARILTVSRQTVQRWTKAGLLTPAARLGPRGIAVYDLEAVRRFAEDRKAG